MSMETFASQMRVLSACIYDKQRDLASWQKVLAEHKQSLSEIELEAAIIAQNAPGATSDTKRKLAQETFLRDHKDYSYLLGIKNVTIETIAKETAEFEHWLRQFRILELQCKATIAVGAYLPASK
ncbi:MAG: hypothetical protein RBJ76_13135 [Stenomitos frigidus ULC029]